MDDQGSELREAIAKSRHGRARWRCPAGLRSEVVSYVQGRREAGLSVMEIASDLGVSDSPLQRWIAAERQGGCGEVRAIRVKETFSVGGVVLVTPRGIRVEGLSVSAAADLLRSL